MKKLLFLILFLFPLPACAAAPFVTDSVVTSTITSTTMNNAGTITTNSVVTSTITSTTMNNAGTITTNAMTTTTLSPGTVSATTFTAGSTIPSPIISGTVTGSANYTSPTITNGSFAGTNSFSGTTNDSRSCVTNFVRGGLNNCVATAFSATTVTALTTCTTVPLISDWSIPASALTVTMPIQLQIVSGSSTGDEYAALNFYSDAGCTAALHSLTLLYLGTYNTITSASHVLTAVTYFPRIYNNGATTIYAKKTEVFPTAGSTIVTIFQPSQYTQ